ncbi:MAG: UDP-glucose 4-epimerase GalE [Cryobacterium sp.]|nr:UDP-glucose 4-epimerase GalE [Oligoflexia bacterium]
MASVLVVGGAGYVGSAVAAHLLDRGDEVWVLDDLSTGRRSLVLSPIIQAGRFIEARAGDQTVLEAFFRAHPVDAVLHFAAKSQVGESVRIPDVYWENNVGQTRALLDAMVACDVKRFVFSSTAAVYGDPGDADISEDLEKKPINPYGETKLAVERILEEYGLKHGLRSIALRYFNAAGADEKLRVGESHDPETHLIPNLLAAAIEGREISIYGNDYPTRDGTCVRDYVHVEDLAAAHAAAVDRMILNVSQAGAGTPAKFEVFNLGSESGYTVGEVIAAAEKVLGLTIRKSFQPRRPGDPAKLVAKSERARSALGFSPRTDALKDILKSAFAWENKKRALKKAVFLDRDGTLNFDPGYLNDAEHFHLFPGVAEALRSLSDAGYLLIVVSNQSGIARDKITLEQLRRIHEKLDRLLGAVGVRIHDYSLCFHHPDESCECRKPKPRLLLDMAARYSIDLGQSYMIGDKASDVEAGRAAGVAESYLVSTGYGAEEVTKVSGAEKIYVPDLTEAVDRIIRKSL